MPPSGLPCTVDRLQKRETVLCAAVVSHIMLLTVMHVPGQENPAEGMCGRWLLEGTQAIQSACSTHTHTSK